MIMVMHMYYSSQGVEDSTISRTIEGGDIKQQAVMFQQLERTAKWDPVTWRRWIMR